MNKLNAEQFKEMIRSGCANLENHSEEINTLNVFPVPDGDTGTNMSMTFTNGYQEAMKCTSDSLSDVAKAFSRGLLMGARGNSGVITSQIFRGFYQQIKGENDVVYGEKQIAAEQILDNSYVSVPLLEPQAYTQDGDLKLVITSTSEGGKAITLYKTENDGIADCALTVDGREQAGDVVVRFVNKEYTQLFKSIIVFTGCLLALLIYYILQRKFGHNVLTGILSFVLLFAIYVLRTPEDFFSSYLWAEDGTVLTPEIGKIV